MFGRILGFVTVIIAVVLAVLAIALPPANINFVIIISKFFEVMIPVLAVGALIKFLLKPYSCDYYVNDSRDPNFPPNRPL